jgi:hypothetical protein
MLKKLSIPILALASMLAFATPKPVEAVYRYPFYYNNFYSGASTGVAIRRLPYRILCYDLPPLWV